MKHETNISITTQEHGAYIIGIWLGVLYNNAVHLLIHEVRH
jgi:hypothetical protein